MRKNACRLTQTRPGLTFRPAAEMKPIRVSTCLCHFHVIYICKPGSPIAPQLHGAKTPIGRSGAFKEPMAEPVVADPALPDTLPWEKQHGPSAGCTASTLTRRTSNTSAARARRSYWIYRWTKDEEDHPLHPGKVRSRTDSSYSARGAEPAKWLYFQNYPEEFDTGHERFQAVIFVFKN